MPANDIIDQIKHDHRELEQYYSHYKVAQDYNDKEKWFNQFIWEVSRHAVAEELVVYPVLESLGDRGIQIAQESREDHNKTKVALRDIESSRTQDHVDESKVDAMMDDLTKHIQKEEKEDLVFLERNLNLDERASMGKKFSMKKKIVPTRPHPEIPDHPTMLEAALGLLMTPFDKLADLFREFPEHTDDIQT